MATYKQSFIQGAVILLAAGIVNRMLGFVPRIALPRIIGAEGIGLYQMGYPFLIVVLTLITGGIPLAVAKLIAESGDDQSRQRAVLRTALGLALGLGIALSVLCLLLADWITSRLFTDSRVYYTFIAMSPIIVICGVSAVYRGYFQGLHNMIPTALSQIAETLVRIAAVLLLARLMLPYGVAFAAAGAMAGVMLGELAGALILLQQYRKQRGAAQTAAANRSLTRISPLRSLLTVSLPVTASRLVGSGSYFAESILLVQSLAAAGVATAAATAQYGALQGMVIPIVLLPTALTYSLAVALVPSLSEAAKRGDMRTVHIRMRQSIRLALVTGAPFAAILYMLAEPVCLLIYGDQAAGDMLKMMAPIALFIYAQAPLQAALQALDKPGDALRNTFVGACVKLTLIPLLASNPSFGIMGAIVAININIALVTLLHWRSVSRMIGFTMPLSDFLKLAAALGISASLCGLLWQWLPGAAGVTLKLLAASAGAMLAYIGCGMLLGLINMRDVWKTLRIGKRMAK